MAVFDNPLVHAFNPLSITRRLPQTLVLFFPDSILQLESCHVNQARSDESHFRREPYERSTAAEVTSLIMWKSRPLMWNNRRFGWISPWVTLWRKGVGKEVVWA